MITIKQKGNFNKTTKFLNLMYRRDFLKVLDQYGREGVEALSSATPVDSGETARSWSYEVHTERNRIRITWNNTNMADGVPIAILIQYGHGTRNGAWVEGKDFINPAIQPVFDRISDAIWGEVVNS